MGKLQLIPEWLNGVILFCPFLLVDDSSWPTSSPVMAISQLELSTWSKTGVELG